YPLTGWQLTPAPYFFPEMPLYFLSAALTPNIASANCLYAGFILVGLFAVIYRLLRLVSRSRADRLMISGLLALLMFALALPQQQYWLPVKWLLAPGGHNGDLLCGLVLLDLAFSMIERVTRGRVILFLVISCLTVVSDRLALAQFLGPLVLMTLLAFLMRRSWNRFFAFVAVTLSGGAAYQLVTWFFDWNLHQHHFKVPRLDPRYGGHDLVLRCWELFKPSVIEYAGPRTAIFILAVLGIVGTLALLVHLRFNKANRDLRSMSESLALLAVLSIVTWLVVFSLPVLTAVWGDANCLRYTLTFLIFPLLLLGLIACHFLGRLSNARGMSLGAVAWVVGAIVCLPIWKEPAVSNATVLYTPSIATIDHVKTEYGLHAGYSGYWLSKPATMFSRNGVQLSCLRDYLGVLESDTWINNPNHWCQKIDGPPGDYPLYDYVLCGDVLQEPRVLQTFGQPAKVVNENGLKFLIYNRPSDVLFRCAGRAFAISAADAPLPSRIVRQRFLNHFKPPCYPWNGGDVKVLRPGDSIALRLQRPIVADVLDITTHCHFTYHVQFKLADALVGSTDIQPVSGTDLQPQDVLLAKITGEKPFDTIVISAPDSPGLYSVGSVIVFPDPILHPSQPSTKQRQ
ncbi:MAG TPA: hypothetical protein VFW23_08940, partial [Tepidisphaeraceae bacterium]|nr:hypothetical protein [Tepidisphaeraceae bacterium]